MPNAGAKPFGVYCETNVFQIESFWLNCFIFAYLCFETLILTVLIIDHLFKNAIKNAPRNCYTLLTLADI